MSLVRESKVEVITDENGNSRVHETRIDREYKKDREEPDYIKIYTHMWCDFMELPPKWHSLFLAIACRITYADASNTQEQGGQLVSIIGDIGIQIMKQCGWTNISMLRKGMQALCKYNIVRRVSRGLYQINPQYAGRGFWEYKAAYRSGGIVDLLVNFKFSDKTVVTSVKHLGDNASTNLGAVGKNGTFLYEYNMTISDGSGFEVDA